MTRAAEALPVEKDSLARTHRHHRPRLAVRRQRPDPRRRNGQPRTNDGVATSRGNRR